MKNFFKINRAQNGQRKTFFSLVAKKKIFTLAAAMLASFSLWAATATYVPLGVKTITSNTTVYCTDITSAGTPATDWVVVPTYGTSSKGYTQITSTTDNGNPQGITDNLSSTSSNVAMIQIKKDGNTYSDAKRVIHMHVKGVSGVIAHGNTSSGYGLSIAVAEFSEDLSTFPSDITSGVRKSNSGSILIQKTGLDATKEYIISIYSSGGDIYFYAAELIAGELPTYSVTYKANGSGEDDIVAAETSIVADNTFAYDGYKFIGWNTSANGEGTDYAAGDIVSSNLELYAQWAKLYSVTYNANEATGTAPTEEDHIAGETFEIAAQGSLVTPEGKAFNGWIYNEETYAAGVEFTMPEEDVEFEANWINAYTVTYKANGGTGDDVVEENPATIADCSFTAPEGKEFNGWKDANGTRYEVGASISETVVLYAQWRNLPVTIFHWRANETTTIDNANGTTTGGTVTLRTTDTSKSWATENATYVAGVADDMKATTGKELKAGSSALYLELALTEGTFKEGDIILATGYLPWGVYTTTSFNPAIATVTTGTDAKNVATGRDTIASGVNAQTLYVRRAQGSSSAIAAIKIIRYEKNIVSADTTLTAVTINDVAISAADLATLLASPYTLDLATKYVEAPTVKFTKHIEVLYDDDSEKIADEVETVVATSADTKWQAQLTIDETTYTISAVKPVSYQVTYMCGEEVLGTEAVEAGEAPATYASYQSLALATFNGWYSDADLADEHAVTIASAAIVKDTTFYASFTYHHASSVNIEGLILADNKTNIKGSVLTGTNGYASNFSSGDISNDTLKNQSDRNYAYLGLKIKVSGAMLNFRLAEGSVLKMKFGNVGTTPKVSINGSDYANMTITDDVYTHTAEAEELISFKTADAKAVVLKQIAIDEELANVVYDITCAAAENGTVACGWALAVPGETVALTVTPATGYAIASVTYNNTVIVADETTGKYSFTMPAANVTVTATFSDATVLDNTDAAAKAVKRLENGQLIIEKDGKLFNILGGRIR